MATTISELQEMMKDHLRGQQEDRLRLQEMERLRLQQYEEDRVQFQEDRARYQEERGRYQEERTRWYQEDRARFQEMERVLTEKFQATDLKFQATDLKFQATDLKFQASDLKFNETERVLSEKFQASDLKFNETERVLKEQFKETDRRVREAFELFTSQWGKLVESLVEGDLIRILNERGIPVTDTIRRREGKRGGENYELDIIAINGVEIVIVEVKTTLRPKDVKKFLSKLEKAKIWMPEYLQNKIYGAVAYLESEAEAARMAERQGLFIIKATGDSAAIANNITFQPKIF